MAEPAYPVPDLIAEVLSPGTRRLDPRKAPRLPGGLVRGLQERAIVVHGLSEDGESYV